MKNILNKLLKIIYPKKCIFCQEIIPITNDEFICLECEMDIDYILCDKEPFLSLFAYNEKTKSSIHRLKYFNRKDYAKYFAKMMHLKFCKMNTITYDYVLYVPMHIKKKKKRGYDQSELLAKEFATLTNIKLSSDNLIRTKNTTPQSKVKYEERKSNVENIFKLKNPEIFKNKNVILIDDIYTSGNTIFECTKEIKLAGAKNVCCFVLSKVRTENKN